MAASQEMVQTGLRPNTATYNSIISIGLNAELFFSMKIPRVEGKEHASSGGALAHGDVAQCLQRLEEESPSEPCNFVTPRTWPGEQLRAWRAMGLVRCPGYQVYGNQHFQETAQALMPTLSASFSRLHFKSCEEATVTATDQPARAAKPSATWRLLNSIAR